MNKYKDITTYGSSFEETNQIVSQEWQNGAWVNSNRMTMARNGQGLTTEMRNDTWRSNSWQTDMLTTYTYDGQGNNIETVIQVDTDEDGVVENQSKTESTFNASGQCTKKEDYIWIEGAWAKSLETTYTYNGQGQLTEKVTATDIGGGFLMFGSKTLYTYDGSGLLQTETDQSYNFVTQSWTNSTKKTYAYDGNGKVTEIVTQDWSGTAWVNSERETKSYTGAGLLEEHAQQSWDGEAWANERRTLHAYNGNGQEIEEKSQNWIGGAWVDNLRFTSTYTGDGYLDVYLEESWQGGAWTNVSQWLYNYPTEMAVDDRTLTVPRSMSVKNYPNPFNPHTTIEFTVPASDNITISIFDVSGRLIKTLVSEKQVLEGTHYIQWNGTDQANRSVASGVYFYCVTGESMSRTGRCLLVK